MGRRLTSEQQAGAKPEGMRQPFRERRRSSRQVEPPVQTDRGPPALTPLRFSTRQLAPRDQFAAWAAYIAPLLDVKLPDDMSLDAGFQVDHVVWNLGRLLLVQQSADAYSFERSIEKLRASPIDHWCIILPRSGTMWTEIDGRVAKSQVNCVDIKSLGRPFRGRTIKAEYIFLHVPRDLFSNTPHLLEISNNVVVSGSLAEMLVEYVMTVEARLSSLTEEELPLVVQAMREMIISCMIPIAGRIKVSTKQSSLALMERARQHVQDNLASAQLSPLSLSRVLGISRTQLYSLFETSGGVARYIQKKRLLAGHAALSNPSQRSSIGEIAEQVGFSSAADFSRAFKREFGYSPSDARSNGGIADLVPMPRLLDKHEHNTFEAWLKALGS
ncbi:helix-turn-helix domain-containing protein [Microvirga puerhi]|uniref:Helix-turn-helix domain-containing protein n=1 Tax=Microvirga puerhi TaxID=2876078 RepID=A0ABS7VW17_9HYPH|nr:helix-turn-helix domain-containing protein [Microvirga puerhi]MBZ6079107.1 helix-turn-helix domain-containing protein [Microvirga puerhi]